MDTPVWRIEILGRCLASASAGTDADPNYEPAAVRSINEGTQRRGGMRSEQDRKRLGTVAARPSGGKTLAGLVRLLDQLNESVDGLSASIQQEPEKRSEVPLLMTHPGVRPITASPLCSLLDTRNGFDVESRSAVMSG